MEIPESKSVRETNFSVTTSHYWLRSNGLREIGFGDKASRSCHLGLTYSLNPATERVRQV